MKIVSIVPIKLNNERVPGKNTKLLGGKPLISYCLEELKSAGLSDIYVFCSSEEITPFLPSGVTFLKRPETLDLPQSNFTQIFEAFSCAIPADIYIYAHATAPFVSAKTIEKGINAVRSGNYDSAFCAEKIQDFLWQNGRPLNFNPQNVPRSQDLPVVYRETSGVYVFTKDVFEKHHRRIGTNPYIIEVNHREAVDINTFEDLTLAEILLAAEF